MSNWRQEYLTSLKDSEMSNPVNMDLVQTCSQMADRISALEAQRATLEARLSSWSQTQTQTQTAAVGSKSDTTGYNARQKLDGDGDGDALQLRHDLAEALRSKGTVETRLRAAEEELVRLRSRNKEDARSVGHLTAERTALKTRLNDREYELREKRKLLEQVQDEMIALNLQVSMAEKERDKFKKENKELVDRWMKRMAHEADAMNLANEPRTR